MSSTKVKLVDGAFFEGLLLDYGKFLGVDMFDGYRWDVLSSGALRCIFYDALPVKKSNQSEEDFGVILENKIDFLNRLRSIPNFHVRDGITRLRTRQSGSKMSEVFEQKGVDTWIAVEAMQYALNGIADEVHIYTSDADLYPVFEALQNTRCRGFLWYREGKTAKELIYSADRSERITVTAALSWSKWASEFQIHESKTVCGGTVIHQFESAIRRFEILHEGKNKFFVNIFRGDLREWSATCKSIFPLVDQLRGFGGELPYSAARDLIRKI